VIPVSVITGFLGSGKTTLLARLLRHPEMGRTAVVINEFGAVGLDHELVEAGDESTVQLANGCLCCSARSDLVLTLGDLAARRAAGTVPPFDRVVIETSGLADPAPILQSLMTDRALSELYALDRVVTTVDAVIGLATLADHEQSLRQAAIADTIILTKTDIPEARADTIAAHLATINPGAVMFDAVRDAPAPAALFGAMAGRVRDATVAAGARAALPRAATSHIEGITTFSIVRDAPMRAVTLALFLSALAENCGRDLLRMKGLVRIAEEPERPAVVHGVQHVYHAPSWLERWPSDDRRTRMTFIGKRIPESWVLDLLDLLDAEVADEMARVGS
jgi:G3E family GTPase